MIHHLVTPNTNTHYWYDSGSGMQTAADALREFEAAGEPKHVSGNHLGSFLWWLENEKQWKAITERDNEDDWFGLPLDYSNRDRSRSA